MLMLRLKMKLPLPMEVERLLPEHLLGCTRKQLEDFPVAMGNRRERLGDWFEIDGEQSTINAPLRLFVNEYGSMLHRVGERMSVGTIVVEGNVGRHAGAYLAGGSLVIHGNAGDWAGAEMAAGLLVIHGNAGSQLGACYRGSLLGMRGGQIMIHGDAGDEVGLRMRRGMILVQGSVGDHAGAAMIAGTMVARDAGVACGAGMKRGTILLAERTQPLPPGHRHTGTFRTAYLNLLLQQVQRQFSNFLANEQEEFSCFRGDLLHGGLGEIWTPVLV